MFFQTQTFLSLLYKYCRFPLRTKLGIPLCASLPIYGDPTPCVFLSSTVVVLCIGILDRSHSTPSCLSRLGCLCSLLMEAVCGRAKAGCCWGWAGRHCCASPRCVYRETWLGKVQQISLCLCLLTFFDILIVQAGMGWTAPSAAPVAHGALAVT